MTDTTTATTATTTLTATDSITSLYPDVEMAYPDPVVRAAITRGAWLMNTNDYRDFRFIGRYFEVSQRMARRMVEYHIATS